VAKHAKPHSFSHRFSYVWLFQLLSWHTAMNSQVLSSDLFITLMWWIPFSWHHMVHQIFINEALVTISWQYCHYICYGRSAAIKNICVISFDLNLFTLCFVACCTDPVQVPCDLHKYFVSLNESLCFTKFYFIFAPKKYNFTFHGFHRNSDLVSRVPQI
jgi:hypothetical protein